MPKKKYTPEERKTINKFVKNLSIGIPGPESSHLKDPNKAQNSEGSAAGKYQFTKWWLKNGNYSIQKFAKENGFKVPQNMDDFKADGVLQDSYFRGYAENILYPHAKKAFSGKNPAGLTLDEMGALFHFKPPQDDNYGNTGVYKQISTGKFDEATKKGENGAEYTNMSSLGYLKAYNKWVEKAGESSVNNKDIIDSGISSPTSKNEILQDYITRSKIIDESENLEASEKEVLRKQLYDDISKAGNAEVVNGYIDTVNAEDEYEHNKAIADYTDLRTFMENTDFVYDEKSGDLKSKAYFKLDTDEDKALLKKINDQYGIKVKGDLTGNSAYDVKKLVGEFEKQHLKVTGQEIKFDLGNEELLQKNDSSFVDRVFNTVSNKDEVTKITFAPANPTSFKKRANVQPPSEPRSTVIQNKIDETKVEEVEETEEEETEDPKTIADDNSGLAMEFLNNQAKLDSLNPDDFNYTPGKKDLPIDAVMGLSMGLIGNEQAKNANIPLRTEDVSQAFKSYVAELADKSKQGLPVEVEAQMKSMLADAYQGGLESIVNASGGNRATVLGNLGSLEQAKSKGLVNMQIADYEAKDRAFAQYGDAIKYINEFDANRDIANHGIKYDEAKQKQLEGKALAVTGMQKLSEALRYDKENGPGSANDMYRGLLMQKMFGFDPKAKDDGTGEVKGTKSYYDAQKKKQYERADIFAKSRELVSGLGEEAQSKMDEFVSKTNDPSLIYKAAEYMSKGNNPNSLNLENINDAKKSGSLNPLINLDVSEEVMPNKELNPQVQNTEPGNIDNLISTDISIGSDSQKLPQINSLMPGMENNQSIKLNEPNIPQLSEFEKANQTELPEPNFSNKYDPFGALNK